MKKIFIVNGSGGSGKTTFEEYVGKYIPVHKYSIVDLPKKVAVTLGWKGAKTDKDRKFLSDLKDLSSSYNDAPFSNVKTVVRDFMLDKIDADVLFIDMRSPEDIRRAFIEFGAKSILIRNPNKDKIESNHADANVENYDYDYIIENDGTLEQLDKVAHLFTEEVIRYRYFEKPILFKCSSLKGNI